MSWKVPYDPAKAEESARHIEEWLREPVHQWIDAFSYLHSVRIPRMEKTRRLSKREQVRHYWGKLGFSDSYLVWSDASSLDRFMFVARLEWLNLIGVQPGMREPDVKYGPPPWFATLSVMFSQRQTPERKAPFPGVFEEALEPPMDGPSAIMVFAVDISDGGLLIDKLEKHLVSSEPRFEWWESSRDSYGRLLLRHDEPPVSNVPERDEYALIDSILEDMSDEEFRSFATVQEPAVSADAVFCGQCGVENPMASNFCAKCGSKLVKL